MGIIRFIWTHIPWHWELKMEILPILSLLSPGANLFSFEFILSFVGEPRLVVSAGIWKTQIGGFIMSLPT